MAEKEQLHIADLFKKFASVQKKRLNRLENGAHPPVNGFMKQLLSRYHTKRDAFILKETLLDPYFPLSMLVQTIFADVVGMRFYINKHRPDLEPVLARELLEWATAFFRIRIDLQTVFDPGTVTCIPVDGERHPLPAEQWCTLCGVCCQIGGVPSTPPPGIRYPEHWYAFLAGDTLENQQLCPFLFQYFGEERFFCSIHHVKPMACRRFDREECRKRLSDVDLHFNDRIY
jgi:hypothetical protein